MTTIAIRAKSLSKQFHIGKMQGGYKTVREIIVDAFWGPLRRVRELVQGHAAGVSDLDETIWALREVDFHIQHGEVVGIIGRNGAGKSTLLKILARITEPSEGYVEVFGRVGSLLEVGTGFHQELTGRENIYLNGAILGMRKAEIERKFDEIVAFAEVDKFLDTPVKHYSTGMQTRLGFAVAAHLDPEILLVDEVLSVGDVAFQEKCLGKIRDVSKSGRTVVFVSHNMGTISQLCGRVLWLDGGQIRLCGDPSTVVGKYLAHSARRQAEWVNTSDLAERHGSRIKGVRILTEGGEATSIVHFDQDFRIEIAFQVTKTTRNLGMCCRVVDGRGITVWSSWDTDATGDETREPGEYRSVCHVPGKLLRPSRYYLTVGASDVHGELYFHESALSMEVSDVGWRIGDRARIGVITPVLDWDVIPVRKEEVIVNF